MIFKCRCSGCMFVRGMIYAAVGVGMWYGVYKLVRFL